MQINWNVVLVAIAYAAITGVLNLLLSERSRIDTWAESNPKLAALMKLCRAAGFDPWNLVAAASLFFKGKLPGAVREGKTLPPPPFEKKSPSLIPPTLMLCLAVVALMWGCGPSKPPCDQAQMAAVVADCAAKSQACVDQGIPEDKCPTLPECDKRIEAACRK